MTSIAATKLEEWRNNPLQFACEAFDGFEPGEPFQEEFFRVLADPSKKRIAMKAAKGPGKSCVLALAIWWFMLCMGRKGKHPTGCAISITKDNLKQNLWRELVKWWSRSDALKTDFDITAERLVAKQFPTRVFTARSWSPDADKDQQKGALAGIHDDFTLIVVDESSGIPDVVFSEADGSLSTGVVNKVIQAGNPTHNTGPLWRACNEERHLWHTITVTGDPDDPKRSKRMKLDWCREQIEKYGRDNPWVRVNVFNEFPSTSLNALLGRDEVKAAMRREAVPDDYQWSQKRFGVDVARFGDDATVIVARQGLQAYKPIVLRNERTTTVAARLSHEAARWKADALFIDDGGVGAGVVDAALMLGLPVIPVSFAGKPTIQGGASGARYANLRAQMWYEMAEWVKRGGCLAASSDSIDNDPLLEDLTNVTYTYTKSGELVLEPKEKAKERLGRSPDWGDALACTFAVGEMPGPDPLMVRAGLGFVAGAPQRFAEAEYDVLATGGENGDGYKPF